MAQYTWQGNVYKFGSYIDEINTIGIAIPYGLYLEQKLGGTGEEICREMINLARNPLKNITDIFVQIATLGLRLSLAAEEVLEYLIEGLERQAAKGVEAAQAVLDAFEALDSDIKPFYDDLKNIALRNIAVATDFVAIDEQIAQINKYRRFATRIKSFL
ncbi:MAG: hypothetical protein HC773_05600 [Scytonema sp. CRU_2_7]|nr:hypothetical protein [Scytonema sp. CRU_2_7]